MTGKTSLQLPVSGFLTPDCRVCAQSTENRKLKTVV
jgi:hypothetical protein